MTARPERLPPVGGGICERVNSSIHAVVIGGGIAGLAAATILAERGVDVTVVERNSYLGGRAGAWSDKLQDGDAFEMDRGFHAFFRQYYNLRRLLRRFDPELRNLIPLDDYPLIGPGGNIESFSGLPHSTPWNIISLIYRTPSLALKDLTRVNILAALKMLTYHPQNTYRSLDQITAREYLDSLRLPADARQLLFNVFAHSFFNPEEGMSAADLIMMFHFYFIGNPEGIIFDVLSEPFSFALWRPWRRYLENLGVQFILNSPVQRLTPLASKPGWHISIADHLEPLAADAVVLAVDVSALQTIVAASPTLGNADWRYSIEQLDITLPFAVWRLWLDKPVKPGRHPFVGTAGYGVLENISLYELFQGQSRRWALQSGGSVVELHAYAVPVEMEDDAIRKELKHSLEMIYPELINANVLEERYLRRQDCPAVAPGSYPHRPGVATPMQDVALAGDFTKLPIPSALMERAATSGIMAANYILSEWDVDAEEVWSVPSQGILNKRYWW